MITFLALIGLIVLLWLASKALKKVGHFFDNLSEYLSERSISTRVGSEHKRDFLEEIKKIREKTYAMKGKITDEEYWDNVRKQIKDLTEGD